MTIISTKQEPRTLTASAADPTRREDENGVVIGPWTAWVKQSTRMLNSTHAVRRTRT